jgi:ketosteroid isomerase-like protein
MSKANIALVQGLYADFGRGDVASIVGGLTPDIDWQTLGPAKDYPVFGPRKGKAAVQEFFAQVAATEEFSDFSPREFHATDDKVFALGSYAGKIKKTGRSFACEWVHVFTVVRGKISRFREYTDTAQFVAGYRG